MAPGEVGTWIWAGSLVHVRQGISGHAQAQGYEHRDSITTRSVLEQWKLGLGSENGTERSCAGDFGKENWLSDHRSWVQLQFLKEHKVPQAGESESEGLTPVQLWPEFLLYTSHCWSMMGPNLIFLDCRLTWLYLIEVGLEMTPAQSSLRLHVA